MKRFESDPPVSFVVPSSSYLSWVGVVELFQARVAAQAGALAAFQY